MEKQLMLKPQGACYSVYWEGGGEVPKALNGLFTSRHAAQLAIDAWQNAKPVTQQRQDKKVKVNGEKQN